jgi:hypothetical protein
MNLRQAAEMALERILKMRTTIEDGRKKQSKKHYAKH